MKFHLKHHMTNSQFQSSFNSAKLKISTKHDMGQGSRCCRTVYLNRSMWFYTSQTDGIYTVGRVTTDHTVKTHFAASKTESKAHTRGSYVWGKGSKNILKGGRAGEEEALFAAVHYETMKQIQSESPQKGRMATARCSALPAVYSTVEHKTYRKRGLESDDKLVRPLR